MKRSTFLLLGALVCTAPQSFAGADDAVRQLQERWAEVRYQVPEKERKDAFEALADQADEALQAAPDSAALHTWAGIIHSTWAGDAGPFGAMKHAKRARAELEQAIELEPDVLQGSAYTSLGALLWQIPGIMGGSDEMAENYLRKGLEINPQGIDANYFYAQFLAEQGRGQEAGEYLARASQAPARPGRELADRGRHQEIAELQARIAAEGT